MAHTLKHEGGAVLIEFALTLPLLLVLFAGMFDFGLMFQRYQVLTNAAREGARMAVLPGYTSDDVQARVASYLTAGGVTEMPTTTVEAGSVTPAAGPVFGTMRVTVSVTRAFSILGPIASLIGGGGSFGSMTLKSQSEMRVEVAAGV